LWAFLPARKLRFDIESHLFICSGNALYCTADVIKKMVFNPASYKVVWYADLEIIVRQDQSCGIFEPNPVFLLPDAVCDCLVYRLNFLCYYSLHCKLSLSLNFGQITATKLLKSCVKKHVYTNDIGAYEIIQRRFLKILFHIIEVV
jgi:hypothetical protein